MSEAGKVCTICKQWKVIDAFVNDRTLSTGKGSRCKECVRNHSRDKRGYKAFRERPYDYKQISETLAVIPVKSHGEWLETVVDLHLAPELAKYSWSLSASDYVVAYRNNQTIQMHRLVLNLSKLNKLRGDHENGIRTDNYLDNLRPADNSLNARNVKKLRKNNTSGFMGITLDKRTGKWDAAYSLDSEKKYIGSYKTKEEAARAYDNAIRALNLPPPYFLNFPDEADI